MSSQPTDVLLDANLLLFITVGMFDHNLIGRKRLDGFTPDNFDQLKALIGRYSKNLTTPYLLAEVITLADQCVPKKQHWVFRRFLQTHYQKFDERWMKSTELSETQSFLRLGLSDAAVCQLAAKNAMVISDDIELCATLLDAGLNVVNFSHLR